LIFLSSSSHSSPKRVQELRNSKRLTQDLEEAELEIKKEKEAEKREGEEGRKMSVEGFKDKNNDLGELGKIAQELQGDVRESHKENNRSGASSPSPSIGECDVILHHHLWRVGRAEAVPEFSQ